MDWIALIIGVLVIWIAIVRGSSPGKAVEEDDPVTEVEVAGPITEAKKGFPVTIELHLESYETNDGNEITDLKGTPEKFATLTKRINLPIPPAVGQLLETGTKNVRTISFENIGFDSFNDPGVFIRAQTVHLMSDEFPETIGLLEKVGWRIEVEKSSIK